MTAIETTHALEYEADQYDVKVPEKLTDAKTGEKIVAALRKWNKRNDRAA
ncbi:hypothetical protein [Mesorhizobium escarrei]|uniref:Uncharacterized protein n=1 Tax=Mesorhizobium escarrei TaxID=666018 RepID=A0ABM9EIZ8_9HYPH|nr:hypothetical protein [Mesorhizobium escarrei]CAH2409372.1 hypothetical protein MES5069_830019 [Mesorhizobium escarrei]